MKANPTTERRKVLQWPGQVVHVGQKAVSYSSELVSASLLIAMGVFIGTLMGFAVGTAQTSQYEQAAARALVILEVLYAHHFTEEH